MDTATSSLSARSLAYNIQAHSGDRHARPLSHDLRSGLRSLKEKLNREHPCSISHPRQEDLLDFGQAPEATKVEEKKLFGLHRSVSYVTADFAGVRL